MPFVHFDVGDRLLMKKNHPCGSREFTVSRVGSDVKICCTGCNRPLMLPREKLEKMIKKVISDAKEGLN